LPEKYILKKDPYMAEGLPLARTYLQRGSKVPGGQHIAEKELVLAKRKTQGYAVAVLSLDRKPLHSKEPVYFISSSMKIQMQLHIRHPSHQSNGYVVVLLSLLSVILSFLAEPFPTSGKCSKCLAAPHTMQQCQPNLVVLHAACDRLLSCFPCI
jgi:hypothetical protein